MTYSSLHAHTLDFNKVKDYERQLDDVMEIVDIDFLKKKIVEVEQAFSTSPTELNKARVGIIYHEAALNLSFLSDSPVEGYAQKSYDILNEMHKSQSTTLELLPFISSYRASALSLVSGETKKLKPLGVAFQDFEEAINKYASVSYCPEFMRSSVAENLPWFFFAKRRLAKKDLESIIRKQAGNNQYANSKIMSYVYWAWANQHQSKKDRKQALEYLTLAINLDPDYKAGRKRAEELKRKLSRN